MNNGRTCEECGAPLTGRQIYLCDKRIKPECSYNRLLKQRAAHKRAVAKRKRDAKVKSKKLPRRGSRYNLASIQSATPEKLYKIITALMREAWNRNGY